MNNVKLGKTIKRIRGLRELSQCKLAERAGVTGSTISLLEAGKRAPSLKVLEQIAKALRCSVFLIAYLAEADTAKRLPALQVQAAEELLKLADAQP